MSRQGDAVLGAERRTCDPYAAVRWKVVPTLFWMKAPGRRRAIAWVAFQSVQCAGTITLLRPAGEGHTRPPA